MSILTELGKNLTEYQGLVKAISQKKYPVSLYGLLPVHKAFMTAMLFGDLSCPVLYIARNEEQAISALRDIEQMTGEKGVFLPSRDFIFHRVDNISHEFEQKKVGALKMIAEGETRLVATTADCLMARCVPKDKLLSLIININKNDSVKIPQLVDKLVALGYKNFSAVEGQGQFAKRGDILDIYIPLSENPVRIEFFGDEVEMMSYFDPSTQRRTENLEKIAITPVTETAPSLNEVAEKLRELEKSSKKPEQKKLIAQILEQVENGIMPANADLLMPLIFGKIATPLEYFNDETLIILDDSAAVLESATGMEHRYNEACEDLLKNNVLLAGYCDYNISVSQLKNHLNHGKTLLFDTFLSSHSFAPREIISVTAKQLPAYGGSFETAAGDIESYSYKDFYTLVLTGGQKRAKNMEQILGDRGIFAQVLPDISGDASKLARGQVYILPQSVTNGFELPAIGLAVISEGQIVQSGKKTKQGGKSGKNRIQSFTDLNIGDYIVHDHHGIGRFTAMEKIIQDGIERDYIKIAFAGTDNLYIPATSLGLISKYIGAGENSNVRLSKLGGVAWEKSKAKAKTAAKDLAGYLIDLYAKRKAAKGFACAMDDDWQRSFEEAFEYDETPDQLISTREIKDDMESPSPMDRLLCGDVGFGKTEVAFRAIMKCLLSGKQAAILVPTTVLARQHFFTARSRFSGYPIEIETLSRFRTAKQQKEISAKLKTGEIDLIIGTHRLLQSDIKFKNMGLLVVDEEQRFGVSHKEKIKEMSAGVDVLTLSATPIPRTLNMALSGLRDMSVLEEAPRDRMPVQTFVLEHSDSIIFDALSREVARGGQVYYLHNRIEDIESTASKIRLKFPEISVETAHGRMDEPQLSDVMNRLYTGEIQVLVCTTIIETGIDVPNVNTIIIENADAMGLSQLHQIRGRVGRSHRHAYAYLTYRRGKVLSEISQKRLSAIREFAEFGAGFKIAMRDLEIRGAGNVLGAEQSGHMINVGYDMYLKLLEEAVNELSDNPKAAKISAVIDIVSDAILPDKYVSDPGQRIDLYRRIGQIDDNEGYEDMLDELVDRFGEPPIQAMSLLAIALLRSKCSCCGICEINQKQNKLIIKFAVPNVEKVLAIISHEGFKKRTIINAMGEPYITLTLQKGETPLGLAKNFVELYSLQQGENNE